MPFAYYQRLSARDRAIYRRSDGVTSLALPRPRELYGLVEELCSALASEERRGIEAVAQALAAGLGSQLDLPPVRIVAARPCALPQA